MSEHPFDILLKWSELNDNDLASLSTPVNCSLLLEMVALLEGQLGTQQVDPSNFSGVVRRMRRLYEDGSWKLGEAIILAAELREQGHSEEANEVIRKFAENCISPFYKQAAQGYLE